MKENCYERGGNYRTTFVCTTKTRPKMEGGGWGAGETTEQRQIPNGVRLSSAERPKLKRRDVACSHRLLLKILQPRTTQSYYYPRTTPSLHYTITTPSLHYTITALHHHCTTPSLHHTITTPHHHYTTPSLHYTITTLEPHTSHRVR